MSHIVESCPLTKLNGGLSRLHSADEDAVSWLTNYGKWHAYEKKKWNTNMGLTRPTQQSHFEWSWVTFSNLTKYSIFARSLCDSWVSCWKCADALYWKLSKVIHDCWNYSLPKLARFLRHISVLLSLVTNMKRNASGKERTFLCTRNHTAKWVADAIITTQLKITKVKKYLYNTNKAVEYE